MTADRIEREIVIAAPIERVWAVLTEPDLVTEWFSQGKPAEIDLRPGGTMRLNHGEGFEYPTRLVRVEPPHFLSYRWASAFPGQETRDDNSTLVEFSLVAEGAGTRLQVVESGFAGLEIPAEMTERAGYDSHVGGWTEIVGTLRQLAERPTP